MKEISTKHKQTIIAIYKAIRESFPDISEEEISIHLKNCQGLKFVNFQEKPVETKQLLTVVHESPDAKLLKQTNLDRYTMSKVKPIRSTNRPKAASPSNDESDGGEDFDMGDLGSSLVNSHMM